MSSSINITVHPRRNGAAASADPYRDFRFSSQAGENVVQLTNTLNQLDLRATMDKVDNTMAGVQQMTERLNSKDNNVGLFLNDTALYGNLNRTTTSAAMLLEDLKAHPKRYVHFSVFGKKEKNTGE